VLLSEQKAGEASIYSNALLEGQQAQQMEQQQQQYNYQRDQQIKEILARDDTPKEKIASLISLGYSAQEANVLVNPNVQTTDYFGLRKIEEEKGLSLGLPSGGINIMGGWRNF
jgi:hypothetical protein